MFHDDVDVPLTLTPADVRCVCLCVLCRCVQVERMDLVGRVEGSECIIVDDMIDTAGTLCQAAETLKQNGASRVFAFASHGLFSGPASDRIKRSSLEEVIVVNTIPSRASAKTNEKIKSVRALRVWAWGWACRRRRRRRRCHRCRRRPASRARLSP